VEKEKEKEEEESGEEDQQWVAYPGWFAPRRGFSAESNVEMWVYS
jgi:hypothetical protein